jgi:hypothetical protein
MKVYVLLLLIITISPSLVFPGEIYGRIRRGKEYLSSGVRIEVEHGGNTYSAVTENYGSYRLYVPVTGKVTFKLYTNQSPLTTTIYSFEKSTRYDFTLEGDVLKMK